MCDISGVGHGTRQAGIPDDKKGGPDGPPYVLALLEIARSGERELDSLFDRIVRADEPGDGGELAGRLRGIPGLLVLGRLLGREELVLDGLCEEAPVAPAPDFLARAVDDHELVRLPGREGELDALAAGVGDVEREGDVVAHAHIERGGEWGPVVGLDVAGGLGVGVGVG